MKKKNTSSQKETKSFSKKVPYIGVCTLVFVGLITILTSNFTSHITLPSENAPTVVLPTAPPLLPASPLPEPPLAPTKEPEPDHQAEPVSSAVVLCEPVPFQINLPADGEIMTPFSDQNLLYSKTLLDWRTHPAVDILAPSGTEVRSAAEGVVETAYSDPLMGETIILTHGEDFKTIYQNLASTQMVTEGQVIKSGQAIAVVGNTASSELLEKTHLHFAVKKNDIFVNPMDYVQQKP